jgi:hypothetical protein
MAFGSTHTEGIFFQHGQYWTSSYYLGLGALWLALLTLACVRERRVWLLGAMAIAGLILALGENTPVYPALRKLIPQLSLITYPVKFISVTIFAVPLLAACALANLEKIKKQLLPIGVVLFSLLTGILFWTQLAPMPGDDSQPALLNGFSRAVFLLLTGAILFLLTQNTGSPLHRLAPLTLLLVAWLDVFTHEPAQNPTVQPWIYEPGLSRTKLALQPQPAPGGSRAMVSPMAANAFVTFAESDPKNNFLAKRLGYCADCNTLDDVPKVDGFFSLTPRESDDVLALFYRTTNADFPRLEDFMGVSQITAPGELFKWQARTNFLPLVTAGQKPVFGDYINPLSTLMQSDFDCSKTVFLSPEDFSFVTVTNQTPAKILNSKFGNQTVDIEVEAQEPSLVVVAQTYYHNWHATMDGQPTPLLRANVAFQAVQVPAGKHKIHLAYRDRAFEIGAAISIVAWLGSLTGLFCLPGRKNN